MSTQPPRCSHDRQLRREQVEGRQKHTASCRSVLRMHICVQLLSFVLASVPALAQSAQSPAADDTSPSFLQGEADRQSMEQWFNSLSGDFHAGAEYWAAQRNTPNPGSCYGSQGADLGQFTSGCLAAQQKLAPIDLRRKTDPEYRLGWNVPPPTGSSQQSSPPSSPTSTPQPAPAQTTDFSPNEQGVAFLKNLVDSDGRRGAEGQSVVFQYQSMPFSDSDDFRNAANSQIDAWMQNGTVPSFANDPVEVLRLFAFYWVGSELPPGSPCLTTPRSDDCYFQILEKLSNVKANQDFIEAYRSAASILNLPALDQ